MMFGPASRSNDDELDPAWTVKTRLVKATPAVTAERLKSDVAVEQPRQPDRRI
jgi:hypothetical protein